MSEEEEIIFDEEDQGGGGEEDGPFEGDEGDEDNTPEGKYQRAKGLLGFNDLDAIDLFYDIYCDLSADIKLQGKALKRAAITLSQTDDFERILGSLTDVFTANSEGTIDDELCSKIVRRMMANLIRNEQALTDFLDLAVEKVNKSTQLPLFVDIKLRQAELALKKADYNNVQKDLSEIEQYVGIPPDKSDRQMCQSAVRILLLKIELAEAFTQNEKDIFDFYKIINQIPDITLNDRQKAVLTKIEGQIALHKNLFENAVKAFQTAFMLFDDSGSDKRLDCLPFLALSIMCTEDKVAMAFNDPKINPYVNHPIVAPLKQLLDQYKDNKYVKFLNLLESAKKVFQQKAKNAEPYIKLLDKVRIFVLRNNINEFCLSYKKLEFKFLSKELQCSVEEGRRVVFELIISRQLQALVDTDANLIIIQEIKEPSIYLENIQIMLNSLSDTVKRLTKKERIQF